MRSMAAIESCPWRWSSGGKAMFWRCALTSMSPPGRRPSRWLATPQLRGGCPRATGVRLGLGAAAAGGAGRLGAWRLTAAACGAARGAGVLSELRADGDAAGGVGAGGRGALEHRRPVQTGQGAGGIGPLRSPQLAGLVSAYHPRPVGTHGPRRRDPEKGGSPCPVHIPLTVPEIRRLLVRLLWVAVHTPDEVAAWSRWRRRHQKVAQECHRR